ncbi:MAG: hypothetical protein AAGF01_07335 [Cyanobacteria bacterium P01_G01_bin.38]
MAIEPEIWIYWGCCCVSALFLALWVSRYRPVADGLISPDVDDRDGYLSALVMGWGVTLLTSVIYVLFTQKYVDGAYRLTDLTLFSVANGVLEQLMFVFWFLVGSYLGQRLFPKQPLRSFWVGYLSYVIYSGLIHPLFWVQVLPSHEPFLPMIGILPLMSLFWMWLLWRYRAVIAIVAMHIVIDFLTIGHLHFPWFESLYLG